MIECMLDENAEGKTRLFLNSKEFYLFLNESEETQKLKCEIQFELKLIYSN